MIPVRPIPDYSDSTRFMMEHGEDLYLFLTEFKQDRFCTQVYRWLGSEHIWWSPVGTAQDGSSVDQALQHAIWYVENQWPLDTKSSRDNGLYSKPIMVPTG